MYKSHQKEEEEKEEKDNITILLWLRKHRENDWFKLHHNIILIMNVKFSDAPVTKFSDGLLASVQQPSSTYLHYISRGRRGRNQSLTLEHPTSQQFEICAIYILKNMNLDFRDTFVKNPFYFSTYRLALIFNYFPFLHHVFIKSF